MTKLVLINDDVLDSVQFAAHNSGVVADYLLRKLDRICNTARHAAVSDTDCAVLERVERMIIDDRARNAHIGVCA